MTGDLQSHEYGHILSCGIGWPCPPIPPTGEVRAFGEGYAEYFMWWKEVTAGHRGERDARRTQDGQVSTAARGERTQCRGPLFGYEDIGAYLWDVSDDGDDRGSIPRDHPCGGQWFEYLARGHRAIWDSLAASGWTARSWASHWVNLHPEDILEMYNISRYHRMLGCTESFQPAPSPPPPPPSPTPTPGPYCPPGGNTYICELCADPVNEGLCCLNCELPPLNCNPACLYWAPRYKCLNC
jgi:hypothetical protein